MFTIVAGDAVVNAIQVEWAGAAPPAPQASYVYRGDGLRHSKTAGGSTTTYTWDLSRDLPEVLQDGTYTYVYGHGLVSQTDGSGTQTYLLSDGLGSTRTLTDGSGTVTASYAYDVFGAVRSSSGTASTDYRFTGEFDDATTSLTYLRARWYDPSTGRFLSKDPFRGFAVIPGSQHRYAYVGNNPVNAVDPNGEFGERPFNDFELFFFHPGGGGGGPIKGGGGVGGVGRGGAGPGGTGGVATGGAGRRYLPFTDAGRLTEVNNTLDRIKCGGPFKYPEDDRPWLNKEGRLPKADEGYYREYTVDTPGAGFRADRRIVQGRNGETYYSDDHYESFIRIDPTEY